MDVSCLIRFLHLFAHSRRPQQGPDLCACRSCSFEGVWLGRRRCFTIMRKVGGLLQTACTGYLESYDGYLSLMSYA
jgi:hypothetical protein